MEYGHSPICYFCLIDSPSEIRVVAVRVNAPFSDLIDDDLVQDNYFKIIVGSELNLGFLQHDLPFYGFEIKATHQLFLA